MLAGSLKLFAPVAQRHVRSLEDGLDDAPNTPSKHKILARRPASTLMALVLSVFVMGLLIFSKKVTDGENGSYLRKSRLSGDEMKRAVDVSDPKEELLAGQHLDGGSGSSEALPSPPFFSDTKEGRQREALEIADGLSILDESERGLGEDRPMRGQGELVAGGGRVAEKQALLLQQHLSLARTAPHIQSNVSVNHLAVTTTIQQVFSDGSTRELTVEASRVDFLDIMSDGLESRDFESNLPETHDWWSGMLDADANVGGSSFEPRQPARRPIAALATATSLREDRMSSSNTLRFSPEDDHCKIAILDINEHIGPKIGARHCDLTNKRLWPFSHHSYGIDGLEGLEPEYYQYSHEYWIGQAIRGSHRYVEDIKEADFIFVDMWCYHTAWLAYIHPLGSRSTSNPESYLRRSLNEVVQLERFHLSKGSDFGLVHPTPLMQGLFGEEAMCEDFASVYNMVPERSSLCVWTPDTPVEGKAVILPYVAMLNIEVEADLESSPRDLFLFFVGGCGHPDPSVRDLFAAGKMMRYDLVRELQSMKARDVQVQCSCDICDNRIPHAEVQETYRNTQFCPVLPSNVQSSRRLSEVVLAGCIPVFIGSPFHTLPLASHINYAAMGVFINVSQSTWIDDSSPDYRKNHMVGRVWRLDDPNVAGAMVYVETLREAVQYLREMTPEDIAAKRRAVLSERWKFYYGPMPESAGGDGRTSAVGELLMRQMCRRAAVSKQRLEQAAAQGIDIADSDVQVTTHARNNVQEQDSSTWSSMFGRRR